MPKTKRNTRARFICAALTTGAVGAALFIAPSTALAAALTSLTPAVGPAGTVVTAVSTGTPAWNSTTAGAIFTTAITCPALYTTTPAINTDVAVAAGTPQKTDTNTASFVVPATLALNAGAAKTYQVCVYNGTLPASTLVHDVSSGVKTFTLVPTIALSTPNGPSGGGNPVTFTAPSGSTPFAATPGVAFTTGGCTALYGPPALAGTSVTKTSTSVATANVPAGVLGTGPTTTFTACLYAGTANSDALIGATPLGAYSVNLPSVSLSSAVGTSAGGNSLTASSSATFMLGVASPGALFTTAATCPGLYTSTPVSYAVVGATITHAVVQATPVTGVRRVANNRLAVTVPTVPLVNASPTVYQACFYNGSADGSSTLVASAPYTSTTVHTIASVSPAAGSALGGDTIVVTGTGFPNGQGSITATLGGLPLAVTPVNSTTFTAITPMHAVEAGVPLVVTTAAGSKVMQAAYSYVNAVQVAPNSAPTNTTVDLSVRGVGFLSTNFGVAATDAHVYLVSGAYDPRAVVSAGNKINGPVADCGNVLVISDNELICTLNLSQRLGPAGALVAPAIARVTVGDVHGSVATGRVITSAAAAFTPADIGQPISGDGIPSGTSIIDVINATDAVISRTPTSTVTTTAATIGGAQRTATLVVFSAASSAAVTSVTAPAGTFSSADIGRIITSGKITGSTTTITAVTANGNGATLSSAVVAAGTATALIYGVPVPNGAYNVTFVNDGSVDADSGNPIYSQSVVSSASTFTVSPF